MPRRPATRSFTLGLLAVVVACGPTSPLVDLAISNVTVIDAVHGVREAQTVLVHDGRIAAVRDATEAVRAATTVDGTGRYLIPGLWDFHVHLTYDDRLTSAMAGLFLAHGVTSIRDTGGALELVTATVQRFRSDTALAPRVFFAGPLLDGEFVVYDGDGRPALGIANPDTATARANVARLAEAGVDFVKIYEMVSPEVFAVLVEEARARGLPIDGHVPLSLRARDVAPLVQSLEHLRNIEMDCATQPETRLAERRRRLRNEEGMSGFALRTSLHRLQRAPAVEAFDDAECAQVFAAMRSTIQVPTLLLNAMGLQPPFARDDWSISLSKLPADVAAEWGAAGEQAMRAAATQRDNTYGEYSLRLVRLMHAAGVPIGAGTDTPIGFAAPGYSLHSELEMLVRAGLPPIEALRAATIRPAEFFGRSDKMGTIAPGMLADLVLLSADPLTDITNTRRIEAVVTQGRLLDREKLASLVR